MTQKERRWLPRLLYAVGAFALFLLGYWVDPSTLGVGSDLGSYQARATNRTESQMVLVLFFSSGCSACNDPALPAVVEQAKLAVLDLAASEGLVAHVIAVNSDLRPESAIQFLKRFGEFDEVTVGGGWRNVGVLRYVWETHPGPPELPQLIILRREVQGRPGRIYSVENERVVARAVGKGEMIRLLTSGLLSTQVAR